MINMTEKELISKIHKLQDIKPRQEWVFLSKKHILGEKELITSPSFIDVMRFAFSHKLAFSSLVVFVALIGIFGFSQNSLPGDTLFAIKKATERGLAVFSSEQGFNLKQANKRLDDLCQIAENNQVERLAPAINEYQSSVSEVAKILAKQDNTEKIKELVLEVQKLEEKEKQVKSLGIEIGESIELESVLVQTIMREVEELKDRTLTEQQQEILAEIEQDCENGDFSQALEKTLMLTNNR